MLALLATAALAFGPAEPPPPPLKPYLVRNIATAGLPASSNPDRFFRLGTRAIFTADDGVSGRELWASDGTVGGTVRLADTCPGPCPVGVDPLTANDTRLFFFATDELVRLHLWVTGGRPENTVQLTGPLEIRGKAFAWNAAKTRLFFLASDGVHGDRLWRTDGTVAGTAPLTDINSGPLAGSGERNPVAVGNTIYFLARSSGQDALWRTDGTAAGTVEVRGDWPFPPFPNPRLVGAVGSRLLLEVNRGSGTELWASDGTHDGTAPLADLQAGAEYLPVKDLVAVGNRTYFIAGSESEGQELWVTDGTHDGTVRLTRFAEPQAFFDDDRRYLYLPRETWTSPSRFVFGAYSDAEHGSELWETDGTPAGTHLLRDLCPGACSGFHYGLLALADRLYFSGDDGTGALEAWKTDGTEAGTRLVQSFPPAPAGSVLFGIGPPAGGRLLFGVSSFSGLAQEVTLWRSSGEPGGTTPIATVAVDSGFRGIPVGPGLLFTARDDRGGELWKSDGTTAGTGRLADIAPEDLGGSAPYGFMPVGNRVLFFADDGVSGWEPWISDGTAAGTRRVAQLAPVRSRTSRPTWAGARRASATGSSSACD